MKATAPTIIKRLREEKGYTQEYLGKLIGVNKATVNRYETGEIDIKRTIAIKLSSVLDVTPSQIMGWDEQYATSEERIIARNKTNKIINDNDIFVDNFVKLLNEKGIEISTTSFRAWCNNEIPFFAEIDDFKILASALGISLNELLGRTYAPESIDVLPSTNNVSTTQCVYGSSELEAMLPDGITHDSLHLIKNYSQLNEIGQKKVLEFSDDLISSGNYTSIGREPGYRIAAHGATETEEDYQQPIEEITT